MVVLCTFLNIESNMTKMKWVEDAEKGLQAHHEKCTDEGGIEFCTSKTSHERFVQIFCYGCREELGFYNPQVSPVVAMHLQALVDEAFKNAQSNVRPSFFKQSDEAIALDMLTNDSEVEEMRIENIGVEDVSLAVENARERV